MGIDTIGDVCRSVAEYLLDGQFIGAFVVEPGGTGMTALMWRMMAARCFHHALEETKKLMIGKRVAIGIGYQCFPWLIHPVFEVWNDLHADRNETVAAGGCFTVPDAVTSFPELHIVLQDVQKFRGTWTAVAHHDDTFGPT